MEAFLEDAENTLIELRVALHLPTIDNMLVSPLKFQK